ncbi:hypothetical protein Tco_0420691 [Tanacetum coccineum]
MEPDIENMTLNEYLDISLDFPHYYEDALIDNYYVLPPLLPCFQPSQPHNERGYESPNTNNEVDIDSMTIFFAQPPKTPNTLVDKKDSDFDEILDDLFSIGAKNLRRMGQEKVHHGCNDVDLEKDKAEVEDDDDGDTYVIWDITVKDVERIRKIFMPNIPDEIDKVIQPLPIHTTPPNDDYVAPATKSILDELLDEFDDEIVNVTMVDEEAAKDPRSHFMKLQVHSVITKTEPFINTRPLSPLCGVFKTSKPCKVDRDIKTPGRLVGFYVSYLVSQGSNSKGMEFESFLHPYRLCTGGGAWILNKL